MLTRNIEQFHAEIERHIEADALVQRSFGRNADNAVGYRGCFIVCTAGGRYSPEAASEKYGLPLPVIRLAEHIHDNLPGGEHVTFFRDFGAAVEVDKKDLSLIRRQFTAYAAADASADAAPDWFTAIRRQRDTLLRLIREAPVVQEAAS